MAKLSEVEVGQIWIAKVSQRLVRVRVDSINKPGHYAYKGAKTRIGLTNLRTNRTLSYTAAKLRRKVC
jgi:hypothetical protein